MALGKVDAEEMAVVEGTAVSSAVLMGDADARDAEALPLMEAQAEVDTLEVTVRVAKGQAEGLAERLAAAV